MKSVPRSGEIWARYIRFLVRTRPYHALSARFELKLYRESNEELIDNGEAEPVAGES